MKNRGGYFNISVYKSRTEMSSDQKGIDENSQVFAR